ncbi:MAG TPA: Gfo/Idh/MocA family oxidoreductase [Humisphaera sp.]|jgi:predicted dehydrogenase|nr:Gfo/Idh/MocA family oxidoreductase [Humisphaera sp.]
MSEPTPPTRRDFVKTTAAAALTAAAANAVITRTAHAAGDDTIKIGLVGCGGRGSGACTQAMSTKGAIKLIAIGDAFEDNAKTALDAFKRSHPDRVDVKDDHIFVGFDAYKQVIDSGVDLVILATPPGFRPIHFEYAVQKGKHVFMEKPVSTDAPGIRRVLAAAEEAKKKNLKVAVGLQRHHQARYIETIKRIWDGEIGDVRALRVYWNGTTPWVRTRAHYLQSNPKLTEMEYQMRNWYFFVWLCGDHINEQHIHNLDVANWIMKGPPVKAQGQGGRQVRTGLDNGEIYDHHFVEFTYADGTTCQSQCRHMDPPVWGQVAEYVHGTKAWSNVGGATFNGYGTDSKQLWSYTMPGSTAAAPAGGARRGGRGVREPDPYQVEHDDFFAAVRADKPYSEAEYGATSTMTALLGRMCTYSGQEIKFKDALNSNVSVMPKVFAWDAPPPTVPDAEGRYPIPMPGKTKVL